MIFMVSTALCTILSVWTNANNYVYSEIKRVGFGSFTAWISGNQDMKSLANDIRNIPEIERIQIQNLIYSNYIVNGQESDSEGQIISYSYNDNKYKFFNNELTAHTDPPLEIAKGELYLSPAMVSMFDVKIGDKILFPIARQGRNKDKILTIKGYYENPYMGSSMIGMKGFLIGNADYKEIMETIQGSSIDALARNGDMLHIFTDEQATNSTMNQLLTEHTTIWNNMEYVYSQSTIANFMLILQNAFSGFLIAFVMILFLAVIVVLVHSLSSGIDADSINIGILKTIGFTSQKLRALQLIQYLICFVAGFLLGFIVSIPVSNIIVKITLTATGILIPAVPTLMLDIFGFIAMLLLIVLIIVVKTRKVGYIPPVIAIYESVSESQKTYKNIFKIKKNYLHLRLATRQVITGKRKYIGICCVAIMLVFFASIVGRMELWLGTDGKGMMDAFNPAEHDIGVQALGSLTVDEVEKKILSYTDITDSYLLAMPDVMVNGLGYTANVITEPNRFNILEGKTCLNANEVVLTQMAANDFGVSIGDKVTVAGTNGNMEFVVSGIYQCANDMGKNIGLNQEGYLKIGQNDSNIWCHHYFLKDTALKQAIKENLEQSYSGDIHVHENSWPGLYGIISAMNVLVAFMVGIVVLFIIIVTILTGNRLLESEKKEMGIYQSIGFSSEQLRLGFSIRFAIAAAVGGTIGTTLVKLFADPFVSMVMKMAGISNFSAYPGLLSICLPALMVILLFFCFAYVSTGKIKKFNLL